MKITKCNHCDAKKPADRPDDCFLYCSRECKEAHEQAGLERRRREAETHMPHQRRSEEENLADYRLIGTSGPVEYSEEYFKALEEADEKAKLTKDGKVDGRSKGNRKCGRCGEPGHNARTCGRQKGHVPASLAHVAHKAEPTSEPAGSPEKPSEESREPVKGNAPAPRSMDERNRERASKKSGRKCGKCGESGHNARTCGRSDTKKSAGSKKAGRQNKCGKCGKLGHNARTCKS